MSYEQKELTLEELPQELINELSEGYGTVIFDLDSEIDTETVSRKTVNEYNKETELSKQVIGDPETFKPMLAEGYRSMYYLIRLNHLAEGVCVKQILEMPAFETVNIIGDVEIKTD